MTNEQEIRAKALELAMLSFSVYHDGLFERFSDEGVSKIPPLIKQRAKAIEEYLRQCPPDENQV
jgi:hypothetical protein